MNILITGGAGFIGANIVHHIVKNNTFKKIRVLDNLSTGNKNNIQKFIDSGEIEFIYGDISNLEVCRRCVKGIDLICHQAALGSVPRSVEDPLSSHISNVTGFLNILIAAKENNIKRVVYASSSSVYGDNTTLPKVEGSTGNVLSPYAATKKVDEMYANVFTKCYDMECIGLRYFNVFGPMQDPNGPYAAVIPKFINLMLKGEAPTINGDGTSSRDFTYVENVIQANILALTTKNNKCFGEAFNIGTGGNVTLLQLYAILKKELSFDGNVTFGQVRKGDILHSHADITKAKEMIGYNPDISFEAGIIRLLKSFN